MKSKVTIQKLVDGETVEVPYKLNGYIEIHNGFLYIIEFPEIKD